MAEGTGAGIIDIARQFRSSSALEWGGYSLAERDRRWSEIRRSAASAGFDGIFIPLGNSYDANYLTLLEDTVVVLPTSADRPPQVVTYWGAPSPWVEPTIHTVDRRIADHAVAALRAAGLERGRIGVAGLNGGPYTHTRYRDGVIIHGLFAHSLDSLPAARFENATDLIGYARFSKSDEELRQLELATSRAEDGLRHAAKLPVGRPRAELRAALVRQSFSAGSDYRPQTVASYTAEKPLRKWPANLPVGERLLDGEVVHVTARASAGGMISEEARTVVFGRPRASLLALADLHREVFRACAAAIRPGVSLRELLAAPQHLAAAGRASLTLTVSGRGLGEDGPIVESGSPVGATSLDTVLVDGAVLSVIPEVSSADGRDHFVWGGSIVAAASGGRVLTHDVHRLDVAP